MRIPSITRPWLLASALPGCGLARRGATTPAAERQQTQLRRDAGQEAAPQAIPDVPAPPRAWPRLDPGAVLCRTEDDLARRAAILRGDQGGPADCRPITMPTAIQIVHRAGPGRTEVQVSGHTETGWTDAWLPPTPPPGTTPSRRAVPPPQIDRQ